tara:strand:+ start:345 stop:1148 length:804 start_codon:yes stop_codon:yes gene_type:complete
MMKRIVLSRKGFDSKAGGTASPIFSDGSLFSIPIPQKHKSPTRYQDLKFREKSGYEILQEASVKLVHPHNYCHYDPLLTEEIGIFGQADAAQSELKNNNVGIGDLFLFFGWFKEFHKKGDDLHHLFGWLQVERIICDTGNIKKFLEEVHIKHPHGFEDVSRYSNNTIYVAKKNLTIDQTEHPLPGYGLFKRSHKDLTLTKFKNTRSRWQLPKKYFEKSTNIFLNRLKWKDQSECLVDCIGQGQEYILDSENNPKIKDWALELINKHG